MSSSLRLCFRIPKALPCLSPPTHPAPHHPFSISCQRRSSHNKKQVCVNPKSQKSKQTISERTILCNVNLGGVEWQACTSRGESRGAGILGMAIQVGGVVAAAATMAEPALALTGVNEGEDLVWILIQSGISAFFYFIAVPPLIMNWLRTRWYKRNLLEMYVQFMFVFLFFPGVLLWAPFLNFRKFPRDPAMKYPWSVPENPSEIKGGFLKYPWAQPEDYE